MSAKLTVDILLDFCLLLGGLDMEIISNLAQRFRKIDIHNLCRLMVDKNLETILIKRAEKIGRFCKNSTSSGDCTPFQYMLEKHAVVINSGSKYFNHKVLIEMVFNNNHEPDCKTGKLYLLSNCCCTHCKTTTASAATATTITTTASAATTTTDSVATASTPREKAINTDSKIDLTITQFVCKILYNGELGDDNIEKVLICLATVDVKELVNYAKLMWELGSPVSDTNIGGYDGWSTLDWSSLAETLINVARSDLATGDNFNCTPVLNLIQDTRKNNYVSNDTITNNSITNIGKTKFYNKSNITLYNKRWNKKIKATNLLLETELLTTRENMRKKKWRTVVLLDSTGTGSASVSGNFTPTCFMMTPELVHNKCSVDNLRRLLVNTNYRSHTVSSLTRIDDYSLGQYSLLSTDETNVTVAVNLVYSNLIGEFVDPLLPGDRSLRLSFSITNSNTNVPEDLNAICQVLANNNSKLMNAKNNYRNSYEQQLYIVVTLVLTQVMKNTRVLTNDSIDDSTGIDNNYYCTGKQPTRLIMVNDVFINEDKCIGDCWRLKDVHNWCK